MKRQLIGVILLVLLLSSLTILTSCNKKSDDNAEIQLWYYDYGAIDIPYGYDVMKLVESIKEFCDENQIPLKVYFYDKKIMSYEDYALKRNIAATSGNMIIIEDARFIREMSEQHVDYTKLNNYDNLLDAYKGRFFIPLGVRHRACTINRSILDYYDIKLDKSLIEYSEYLEIKQIMKGKGARFQMDMRECEQKLDYFMNKYNLLFINEDNVNINNKEKFKVAIKSAIIETCDDFIKYNDGELDVDYIKNSSYFNILDKNSGLNIYPQSNDYTILGHPLTDYISMDTNYSSMYDNNVVSVYSKPTRDVSPCFYMYKKITNKKIYDVANFIVSEDTYELISGETRGYLPTFKGELTREVLELDENLNYNGLHKKGAEDGFERSVKITKLINENIAMIMKNNESSKHIVDMYFTNDAYSNKIFNFISNNVIKISESSFNYADEEINKMLDEAIEEFVDNFFMHN